MDDRCNDGPTKNNKKEDRLERARRMLLEQAKKKKKEKTRTTMTTTENDVDVAKKGIEANPRVALFTSGTKTSSFSKGLHCGDGVSQHGSPPQRENEDDSAKATTTKKDTDKEGNEEIDPLDAFMTNEIDPEIAERERLERERAEREREERANMDEAKRRKMLNALVNDSDDDENNEKNKPNAIIYIPTNKVKLFLGASGENVKRMQKSSNCRAQIRKKAKEMYEGFSGQNVVLIDGDENDENEKDDAKTCVELYGDDEAVRMFKLLLEDLFARAKKMKTESRKHDRDRQKEKRQREKRLFHLRHAADYERLGVTLGAPRKEIETAYRKLMLTLHPDKHHSKPEDERARLQRQYDDMRASYDKLLAVDEENIQETKVLGKRSHEEELESLVPEDEKHMEALKRKIEEAKAKVLSAPQARFTT